MSVTSTSSSMNRAGWSATAPANSCRGSCKRSRIGSRQSDPEVSAYHPPDKKEIATADAHDRCAAERRLRPELLAAKVFEFLAACRAEAMQQIDRAIDGHFAQFDEVLVRLE